MFNKTINSVDYNKTSAEWSSVQEDLKESVLGVLHWIVLLLWNVSCWEGALVVRSGLCGAALPWPRTISGPGRGFPERGGCWF